jgi:hypothetical protein
MAWYITLYKPLEGRGGKVKRAACFFSCYLPDTCIKKQITTLALIFYLVAENAIIGDIKARIAVS